MKIDSVIKEVLYEQKEKGLKIFYNVDTFLQEFPEKEEETPEEGTKTVDDVITEAIHKIQTSGELVIPLSDVENIQSLQDLVDYLSDKKVSGKRILDEVVSEIILTLADAGTKPIEDLVDKGDKIRVDVDYGRKKDNSIGFKILKNPGTDAISIVMKKDNKVLPASFQLPIFNQQLVLFRNSII